MHARHCFALAVAFGLLFGARAAADEKKEKDIFDYEAQKAADKDVKKIVFIADTDPHGGRGNHEFMAAAIYLPALSTPPIPRLCRRPHQEEVAQGPEARRHGHRAAQSRRLGGQSAVRKDEPRGFMAIHYGVEVTKGEQGDNYLKWIGGYFETFWSVNPHWTRLRGDSKHEPRGVKPFKANDSGTITCFRGRDEGRDAVLPLPPLNTINYAEGKKPSRTA